MSPRIAVTHPGRAACRRAAVMILFAALAALATLAGAAAARAGAGAEADGAWRVLAQSAASLRLEFTATGLERRDLVVAGAPFVELSLPGGGLLGAPGAPGLPAVGRLVAVPDGALVSARIVAFDGEDLANGRLLPVAAAGARRPAPDRDAYERPGWLVPAAAAPGAVAVTTDGGAGPTVLLGAPAVAAGHTVVPLTVVPVACDPSGGRLRLARRVEIELTFTPAADTGQPVPVPRRAALAGRAPLPAAAVLGGARDKAIAPPGGSPGTWAVVCRNATVQSHLQPLLDWRARQGYRVVAIVSTGTAAAIKGQLQALYDDPAQPPLTCVLLVGDTDGTYAVPTWFENLSGYGGEGDHAYVTLDGADILADAHVGRITFDDLAMLDRIVAKIVGYESNPPVADPAWFRRACVVGDSAESGATTVWVNRWLKGQLLAAGYAGVDTVWTGNFVTQMMNSVNAGRSAFGYRGYMEMSGLTTAHIQALANGGRLPVAILPTCDTGSFAGAGSTCHSEAWLRAANGGAVAAIGTATTGTHTRYNNCYYEGVWDGLLHGGDRRVGAAHTLGKLELYNNYYLAEPDAAEIWADWNNVMGDPATAIWLGQPRPLTVSYASPAPAGTTAITFTVQAAGQPTVGARVCLYRAGAVQVSGLTDAAGQVTLATSPLGAGTCLVTAGGDDLLPFLGTLPVVSAATAVNLVAAGWDDGAGNGDGVVNPGESIAVSLAVTNSGSQTAPQVAATLDADAPWSTRQAATVAFGDVAPGATVWSQAPAAFTVAADAPDSVIVSWPVTISSPAGSWPAVLRALIRAATFTVTQTAWSGGSSPVPGQTGTLVLTLRNTGGLNAAGVTATLTTDSPWVTVTGGTASFGAVPSGATAQNNATPFALAIAPACYRGHLAVFHLGLSYNGALVAASEFALTVGQAATDDPTGPGVGGYYAFDDTDADSWYAPRYDWVALDPAHGGSGSDLGLADFGYEQDDTRTITLPFTFRYCGVDFDQVSICSNGWLAFGETPLVTFRNYALPAKGSPGHLIAAFWDDLYQGGDGRVYTWHDATAHRFVVQWHHLRNGFTDAPEEFELILLDPAWHPTPTGDGAFIVQYDTVNNGDTRDGYATVGLQNGDRTDGLLYTYWNQYAAGAATLTSGRAIRFQPLGAIARSQGQVAPGALSLSLAPDDQASRALHVGNVGEPASFLEYELAVVDPATLPPGSAATAGGAPGQSGAPAVPAMPTTIQGSTLTLSTTQYTPGTTVSINAIVHAMGAGCMLTAVSLQMPGGVVLNGATNLRVGTSDRLFWRGPTGPGALTRWDGTQGGFLYFLSAGQTATSALNLTFPAGVGGDLVLDYVLADPGYFGAPEEVHGSVTLTTNATTIAVHAPQAGAVAVIGQPLAVGFATWNGSGTVDIALQREAGGPWQALATAVPAAGGAWSWTVDGPPGPYACLRVADHLNPTASALSGVFVVSRDLSWVVPSARGGAVRGGQSQDVALDFTAAGLAAGTYEAVLVLTTSGGERFTVPVSLWVDATAAAGDGLPASVTLLGAHPNPANPATLIGFALPRAMGVTLDVFGVDGRRVRRLLSGELPAGPHFVNWDGTDPDGRGAAAGVYLYRLVTDDGALTGKLVLAK